MTADTRGSLLKGLFRCFEDVRACVHPPWEKGGPGSPPSRLARRAPHPAEKHLNETVSEWSSGEISRSRLPASQRHKFAFFVDELTKQKRARSHVGARGVQCLSERGPAPFAVAAGNAEVQRVIPPGP